jgi:chemotaxis protein methyltransferase CheR
MMAVADDPLLTRFARFLAYATGLAFPAGRQAELARALEAISEELGFADRTACVDWLQQHPPGRREVEVLARHLTVGETYFWREPAVFAALEQHVLPELIAERRRSGNLTLRLWSAACCSGEEAYSLAILLARLLPDLKHWRLTILGTDINPHFLHRAERAHYLPWSFRQAPPWLQRSYFKPLEPAGFELLPRIRRLVSFRYLNLAEDSYPSPETNTSAMDLILCRNVLMYFEPAQVSQVLHKLWLSLADGGWLVVGSAETSQALFAEFATVNFPDAVLYHKATPGMAAVLPALSPLPASQPFPVPARMPPPAAPRPAIAIAPAVLPVSKPPDEAVPPYELALARYRRGDYQLAEQALAEGEQTAASKLLMARIAANLGRLEEALHWCELALAANKLDPGSHYLQAAILEEQGERGLAAEALKRALYLAPDFVLAHFALGNLARQLGRSKANKHFDNALRLLQDYAPEQVLPESEGITAGRLAEIIRGLKP